MTQQTPRILEGPEPTIAMNSLDEFSVRASGPAVGSARGTVSHRYGRRRACGGRRDVRGGEDPQAANPQQYSPRNGAEYPATQFGQRLQQIAQLIKADVGLEVAFADVGGWDTHVNQGASTGQLAQRLDDFARSIAALVTDLGDRMGDVTILTMSEFGRTVRQNGTAAPTTVTPARCS